ncbi:YbhB/YbcL family Raf kinase inhibitor-like protein [Patescibacteria group bacterium]|nr:YbhB/YbcL family Raf kinase inhibitor-like protein [Patescibacteria group bacterium]
MQITSSAFGHNQNIPSKYTCDGENISPPLAISDVPEGTKSLVLINDDPDAPGGTWVHWTLWNISSDTTEVLENSFPSGAVQGMTSFGSQEYGGPCPPRVDSRVEAGPPSGTHRYFFKLYALNDILSLSPDVDKSQLEAAMEGHILDRAEVIGLYSRK